MPTPSRLLRCESLEDRTAPAAAGTLDPTFGDDGFATVRPELPVAEVHPEVALVAALPGGRALVLGAFNGQWFVERRTADGRPDPGFGANGRRWLVEASIPEVSFAFTDLAATPDGGVVVVGHSSLLLAPNDLTTSLMVMRFTPDGRPDEAFRANADRVSGFGPDASGSEAATGVAVTPDGRIVIVGTGYRDPRLTVDFGTLGPANPARAGILRLLPDGTPDPSFGGAGAVSFGGEAGFGGSFDVRAADVAVAADGRVVVAGSATELPPPGVAFIEGPQTLAFVARLTGTGALDAGFDGDGVAALSVPPAPIDPTFPVLSTPQAVVFGEWVGVRPDGRVVIGMSDRSGFVTRFVAARLTDAGEIDGGYGAGGFAAIADSRGFADAVMAADGSLVAVTRDEFNRAPYVLAVPAFDTVVYRLTPGGSLDPAFGEGGRTAVPGGSPQHPQVGRAVAVGANGGVTVGMVADSGTPEGRIVLARLTGPALPPGSVLVGGPVDGTARVLAPTGGAYSPWESVTFFPDFAGSVRTAVADVTGDGVPDLIAGAGPDGGPRVAVIDGATGGRVADFFAFELGFTGGVFVAAADLDGDGKAEVVVTPDQGGGPVVAVFDGAGAERGRFFGIDDPAFRGGARAAAGDMTGDGRADLAVAAGSGGGPRVALFDGVSLLGAATPTRLRADFFAFAPGLRNGVYVAVGDVNGDGFGDLAIGAGPGGGPRVRVENVRVLTTLDKLWRLDVPDPSEFTNASSYFRAFLQTRHTSGEQFASESGAELANFFAGDSSLRGGVRVALRDADGDGRADLVTGSGDGEPSRVRVYRSANLLANPTPSPDQELDPYGAVLAGGVFVG